MFNHLTIATSILFLLSCNVRNKKVIEKNVPLTQQIEIKDPTTVQLEMGTVRCYATQPWFLHLFV